MGLLDDLQMGFGLKERTEDYDARTARTIASNAAEQAARSRGAGDHAAMIAGIRARQSYDPSQPTGQSAYYLNRAGGAGYRPAIAEDNRPFMQRMLFSPESDRSPRPYAIGPLTMDQPLPKFGLLGLLSGLGGMFGRDAQEMGPPQTTVRPMLRPEGFVPYMSSGQPETTFTEDFSGVELANFEKPMPIDTLTALTNSAISSAPDTAGMTLITTGPHAGKYMDAGGRLVMP